MISKLESSRLIVEVKFSKYTASYLWQQTVKEQQRQESPFSSSSCLSSFPTSSLSHVLALNQSSVLLEPHPVLDSSITDEKGSQDLGLTCLVSCIEVCASLLSSEP